MLWLCEGNVNDADKIIIMVIITRIFVKMSNSHHECEQLRFRSEAKLRKGEERPFHNNCKRDIHQRKESPNEESPTWGITKKILMVVLTSPISTGLRQSVAFRTYWWNACHWRTNQATQETKHKAIKCYSLSHPATQRYRKQAQTFWR